MSDKIHEESLLHSDNMFDSQGVSQSSETVSYDIIADIPVSISVVVGDVEMTLQDILKLQRGSLIPLNRRIGDPVELRAKGRVLARGEIVHVDQEGGAGHYGVSLTEVVQKKKTRVI